MNVNEFLDLLVASSLPTFILIIWFKTYAFVEYLNLFKLNRFFKVKEYIEYKKINPLAEYLDFLLLKYNNFFVRLITCPFCINFWVCLFTILIFGYLSPISLSFIYINSLLLYFIMCKASI